MTHHARVRVVTDNGPPASDVKPEVVAAQIHDGGDDVLQVRFDATSTATAASWSN